MQGLGLAVTAPVTLRWGELFLLLDIGIFCNEEFGQMASLWPVACSLGCYEGVLEGKILGNFLRDL